jgi:hypothetical protein
MKRNTALTSTYTNGFDIDGTLTAQSLSKAHREPLRGVARGVLVAIGISLLFVPNAGGSNQVLQTYTPKQYAYYSLFEDKIEYKCLAKLYGKESAWNYNAANGSHYGIPQGNSIYLLTANPYEQIDWGIDYNLNRYGSMCKAWNHWLRYGWH